MSSAGWAMLWQAAMRPDSVARDSALVAGSYHAPSLLNLVVVLAAVALLFVRMMSAGARSDRREDW